MQHHLQTNSNIKVQCDRIMRTRKDPQETELHKSRRMHRRHSIYPPGSNDCWHCDGCYKRMGYQFTVQLMAFFKEYIWHKVTRKNNVG